MLKSRSKYPDARSGFALPAAIFALVALSILATGGFFLARQETRIGMASERARSAFYAAELGANHVMSNWDRATYEALADWSSTTVNGNTSYGDWSVTITRMADRLYFLLASGQVNQGGQVLGNANRMLGIVARKYDIELDPPAAFSARDQVRFVGKSTVKGLDNPPPGWTMCTGPPRNKAGMLTDDSTKLDYKDNNFDITGDPAILEDAHMLNELFRLFGDLEWSELTSLATMRLSPRNFNTIGPSFTGDGDCDYSNPENWGDPLDPYSTCGDYFPLIHIAGPGISKINGGGVGQGILMVDGDLWAGGNFTFYGLIIVKGMFETGGSDNRVYGAVMADNAQLEEQSLTGGSLVQYSSCSIERAMNLNPDLNWVRPIERRSWVDLSSVVSGGG
jgi:hypothetical protein